MFCGLMFNNYRHVFTYVHFNKLEKLFFLSQRLIYYTHYKNMERVIKYLFCYNLSLNNFNEKNVSDLWTN